MVVHGYGSKQRPLVPTPARRSPSPLRPSTGVDKVPDRTCLYVGNEPVGIVVGEAMGTLAPGKLPGWYTFTVETPWDPVAFDVRGPVETQLATCTNVVP